MSNAARNWKTPMKSLSIILALLTLTATASTKDDPASALFNSTSVRTLHLTLTPEQWKAIEPSESKGLLLKPDMARNLPYQGENWEAYKKLYVPKTEGAEATQKRFIAFSNSCINRATPNLKSRSNRRSMSMNFSASSPSTQ